MENLPAVDRQEKKAKAKAKAKTHTNKIIENSTGMPGKEVRVGPPSGPAGASRGPAASLL